MACALDLNPLTPHKHTLMLNQGRDQACAGVEEMKGHFIATFSNGNRVDSLPDPTAQQRGGKGSTAAGGKLGFGGWLLQ